MRGLTARMINRKSVKSYMQLHRAGTVSLWYKIRQSRGPENTSKRLASAQEGWGSNPLWEAEEVLSGVLNVNMA